MARISLLSAKELVNGDVRNREDEDLGKMEDIMVDVDRGCVSYGVLSFGGFLSMGDKLFAVPWDALAYDVDNKRFILDVAKQDLRDAPGFDRDDWPDMSDETWGTRINEFYGTQPYWRTERKRRRSW